MADATNAETRPAPEAAAAGTQAESDAPWRALALEDGGTAFHLAWITILTGRTGARSGALALGPRDVGPFRVAAAWPESAPLSDSAVAAVDLAIAERKPIVKRGGAGAGRCAIAYPVLAKGTLHGAVVQELRVEAQLDLRAVAREIEWAMPALLLRVLRDGAAGHALQTDRARNALELLAAVLDEDRFSVAATSAATQLAASLGCDRVSVGFRRGRRSRVAALSHSGAFKRKNELVLRIADCMDEAADQRCAVVWPSDGRDPLTVAAAHQALAGRGAERAVATVPMTRAGRIVGAITAERPLAQGFDDATLETLAAIGGVLGAVLEEKRLNERSLPVKALDSLRGVLATALGPQRIGLKLALLVAVLAAVALWRVPAELRVTAGARIEGEVRRVVAAPLDGYIRSVAARPGDVVRAGAEMARLDDREIELELKRWETLRAQRLREYEAALSARDRAQAGIVRTQISQAEAEIALLEERLAHTRLTAPFDGIVLAGDLDQSVGAPVERGEVLFEIAPLDDYRVILSVDERDLAVVSDGLPGELVLTALPGATYPIRTGRVTSVASVEDGRNVFRVEAGLVGESDELRPGMRGLAKIVVGDRPAAEVWTRGVVNWLRLTFWRWRP